VTDPSDNMAGGLRAATVPGGRAGTGERATEARPAVVRAAVPRWRPPAPSWPGGRPTVSTRGSGPGVKPAPGRGGRT
jgi:hypothetical protein